MKDLDSYLNDHLAGSISALELIAHWVEVHKGEPLGSFFVETEREIKADQDTLRDVMRTLGVEESKVRQAAAWAAEKVGRARLMIAGDEQGSLGFVLTLEGLIMGVTGKKLLWHALAAAVVLFLAFGIRHARPRPEARWPPRPASWNWCSCR